MTEDRDITKKDNTICINWRVVTGSLDNISAKTEINTLFFDKNIVILQKS